VHSELRCRPLNGEGAKGIHPPEEKPALPVTTTDLLQMGIHLINPPGSPISPLLSICLLEAHPRRRIKAIYDERHCKLVSRQRLSQCSDDFSPTC